MRRRYRVIDPSGLHARPAAEFVRAVAQFAGAVRIESGDKHANAKSILQVMALGVRAHDVVVVDFGDAAENDVGGFEQRVHALLEPEEAWTNNC